ncbi:MAG: MinD/ParA family protein [Thermodesulfobacteriota bacterium]|nr:MinD/ParA family protein [Thermodesulfobacteriota bacterium]
MDQASGLRKQMSNNLTKAQTVTREKPMNHAPRVMAVTSGKGGVGKTNVAGNLGVAFAALGKRVLIFDADLGLANIDILFGLNPEFNIGHVISGEKSLKQVLVDISPNVSVIPAGSGLADLTQLTEGQKLNLLSEFETIDADFDICLIDTGAGISDNVIYFNISADECIVVATPEPTSITDAYALIKVMSLQHGTQYFRLLVNMVEDEQEAKMVYLNLSQAADRFLNGVLIEYIGFVQRDPHINRAVASRTPVLNLFPDALASIQLKQIAGYLNNNPPQYNQEGNMKFFLKRFISYSE